MPLSTIIAHAKRPVDWLGKLIEYKLGIFLLAGLFILAGETIIRLIVLACFLIIFLVLSWFKGAMLR